MSTGKAERAGVTAVVDYLDKVDKFEPIISYSDKAPIIDGYFNIYTKGEQKVDNFFAQIPVQVKGTASDKHYYFRIGREHVEAYKQLGGIVFFKVLVDEKPLKILYAILSLDRINELLTLSTKTIKIDLEDIPSNPNDFEEKVLAFANKRKDQKVENPAPKEIKDLVVKFEYVRKYIGEIDIIEVRYDLEALLDSINGFNTDNTIGWRDKFIYYSRKAIEIIYNYKLGDYPQIRKLICYAELA